MTNLFIGFHSLKDLLSQTTKGETVYLSSFAQADSLYLLVQHIHSDLEFHYWKVSLGPAAPSWLSEGQNQRLESAVDLVREELEFNELDVVRGMVAMPKDFDCFTGQYAGLLRHDEASGLFVPAVKEEVGA